MRSSFGKRHWIPGDTAVKAGRDRGCKNGLQCDGDADGNGGAAEKSVYIRKCYGGRAGYIEEAVSVLR